MQCLELGTQHSQRLAFIAAEVTYDLVLTAEGEYRNEEERELAAKVLGCVHRLLCASGTR